MQAAMRTHFGQVADGVDENNAPIMRDMTAQEIVQAIKKDTRQRLIDIVRSIENQAAARAAISNVDDLDAT
jgi:hypothetical protein